MERILPIFYVVGLVLLCGGMVLLEAFPTESFIAMIVAGILFVPLWVPWLRQRVWPHK